MDENQRAMVAAKVANLKRGVPPLLIPTELAMPCSLPAAELHRLARHEAGHAVIALALGLQLQDLGIGVAGGRTRVYLWPPEALTPATPPDAPAVERERAAVCFYAAGAVAEGPGGELLSTQAQRQLLATGGAFLRDLELPIPAGTAPDLPLAVRHALALAAWQQARMPAAGADWALLVLLRGEQAAARLLRQHAEAHAAVAEALVERPTRALSGAEVRRLVGLE